MRLCTLHNARVKPLMECRPSHPGSNSRRQYVYMAQLDCSSYLQRSWVNFPGTNFFLKKIESSNVAAASMCISLNWSAPLSLSALVYAGGCRWRGSPPELLVLITLPRQGNRDNSVARSCPYSWWQPVCSKPSCRWCSSWCWWSSWCDGDDGDDADADDLPVSSAFLPRRFLQNNWLLITLWLKLANFAFFKTWS